MSHTTKQQQYFMEASEFDWEIAPGKTIKAWGFNKQVPGPLLKANAGEIISVSVRNSLPEPTMIHWHGIRLMAEMDGTEEVQNPIAPGETYVYRFQVPDAGTFWYHSHYNETFQMERGMYGALVVNEASELVTDDEKVLMIDDMKLTSKNEFTQAGSFITKVIERHDGRQGNTLLVNGKEKPIIQIHEGHIERWRIVNASSARYFKLSLEGLPFQLIATDGGFIEYPRTLNELLITPGERVDILVGPFKAGKQIELQSLPYNRMTFLKAKKENFATVNVIQGRNSIAKIPSKLRAIEALASQDAPVSRKVKLSVGPSWRHGMNFLVNNRTHAHDHPVKVGELQVWEISNVSLMDHPFHLHGFFFQVISEDGKEPEFISWKDTYNLKPRSKTKIAWIPDNRPGKWMYHCHIIEHHAAGMMGHFEVRA